MIIFLVKKFFTLSRLRSAIVSLVLCLGGCIIHWVEHQFDLLAFTKDRCEYFCHQQPD